MSKKRAIPDAPVLGSNRKGFDTALKENLEVLMGQRGDKLKPLSDTAVLADVITKINEIIAHLQ